MVTRLSTAFAMVTAVAGFGVLVWILIEGVIPGARAAGLAWQVTYVSALVPIVLVLTPLVGLRHGSGVGDVRRIAVRVLVCTWMAALVALAATFSLVLNATGGIG